MYQEEMWLSIIDYATIKKISISTIRRSIKAGHIKYREENGKYFIWTKGGKHETSILGTDEKLTSSLKLDLEFFKKTNRELVEEINDLKMLLSVYESQSSNVLPPIPEFEI